MYTFSKKIFIKKNAAIKNIKKQKFLKNDARMKKILKSGGLISAR